MKAGQGRQQPGRRERKKREVERRIRAAALALFRERGYEATTVEEIAERADVAKGTFFNYFPRKDALLEVLAEDLLEEVFDELGPVEEWTGTAKARLLRLFLCIGARVVRDPELSRVMMIENMRRFWMRTEADPLEEDFHALILEVLEGGRERGEIGADADLELAAKLLEAAYFTTAVEWMKRGDPAEVYERELRGKFEIVFRGLGEPAPGRSR